MSASVFDGGVSAANLRLVTSVDFAACKMSDYEETGAAIINGHSLPFSDFLFVLRRAALVFEAIGAL
jgi:hypothetical protein